MTARWMACCLGWLLLVTTVAGASEPLTARDRLGDVYRKFVEADLLMIEGETGMVAQVYRDAVAVLETLQRQYPGWQQAVIDARLAYARNRLAWLEDGSDRAASPPGDARGDPALKPGYGAIATELTWREHVAREAARNQVLRLENAELKARLRALERMPGETPDQALPPATRAGVSRVLIAEADRLSAEGETEAALDILEAGWTFLARDAQIGLALGIAYCREGRFDEASRILQGVARAQPENAVARLALGAAWMGLGRTGSARVEIEAALQADPRDADAHYNMARLLLMLPDGDPVVARRYYMQSVALGGDPDPEIEQIIQREALRRIGRNR